MTYSDSLPRIMQKEQEVFNILMVDPFTTSQDLTNKLNISRFQLLNIYNSIKNNAELCRKIKEGSHFTTSHKVLDFLLHHPGYLEQLTEKRTSAPLIVEFHALGPCSNNCVHCYNRNQGYTYSPSKRLTKKDYLAAINDLSKTRTKYINFSGGLEPLNDRHLLPAIEKSIQEGLNVTIYTTGVHLTDAIRRRIIHAHRIRISLYGADEEKYYRFARPKSRKIFHHILAKIRETMLFKKEAASKVRVSICCMVLPENFDQIEEMIVLAASLGVDAIEIRAEFCSREHQFDMETMGKIAYIIERIHEKKNKGIYGDLEIDLGEGFYFLGSPETLEKQQIILSKHFTSCCSTTIKIGIDPWGHIFPCALTTQPGVNRGDLKNFMIGNITSDSTEGVISQYRNFIRKKPNGFDLRFCRENGIVCNVFEGNINAWIEKFRDDTEFGINLWEQPFVSL